MKALLPILMLAGTAATAPALAQAPAARPPAAPQPTKIPGVSDAGNAILAKAQTTPDPQLVAVSRQQRALHDQIVAAVSAPSVDMGKLTGLLKQQQSLITQVLARRDDRLLQVAAQLTPADRSAFLKALIAAPSGPAPR